jgi:NAD(P)-dependent dehydrogenase (short-subunit alcohol dehydrogenase family)
MLEDRVVVVTGAGRGLGAQYALAAGRHGAKVVVNDLGCGPDGAGSDPAVAEAVAGQIRAAGGEAVADGSDLATMAGARTVLDTTLSAFGRVDALVNNAGVLRDRMFVNMSEDEWDDVVRGQLRTTFCGSRVFAGHWRERHKAGDGIRASLVNVSSTSGLVGAVGQANYGAAKAAIAALTLILADELSRYDVRANAVVPVARTRMTEHTPGVAELVARPADPAEFDRNDPAHVAPLVVWLASRECPVTRQVYYARGNEVRRMGGWSYDEVFTTEGRWDPADLAATLSSAVPGPAGGGVHA